MKKTFLISLLLSFLLTNSYCNSLIKKLEATRKHGTFINILKVILYFYLLLIIVLYLLFAPTDAAFDKMPESFKKDIKQNNIKVTTKLILSHIFNWRQFEKR